MIDSCEHNNSLINYSFNVNNSVRDPSSYCVGGYLYILEFYAH